MPTEYLDNFFRVDQNLPQQNKVEQLNEMILQLVSGVFQGQFDINEIEDLYTRLGFNRKYRRNVLLGNTLSTFTGWTHLLDETGYSIWKFTPPNYAFADENYLSFDNKTLENRGEALTESATAFDKVFLFDDEAGSGEDPFIDNTTEAGIEGGTAFELMDSQEDFLYIGLDATFGGTKFEFQTRGSGYALDVQYFNAGSGDGFTSLTANTDNLEDNTKNFESDGQIIWDIPSDWQTTTINGVANKFWIRIKTDAGEDPTTIAKTFFLIPANSVPGLLALSSVQVQDEEFAWCSFGGSIYVTIRNTAATATEGDLFITSSSSTTNLQNYFVFNNAYQSDYLDSSAPISTLLTVASGQTIEVGDAVYISGSFEVSLADASDSTKHAHGFVSSINANNEVTLTQTGILQDVNTEGLANIIAGEPLFLSTTPGTVTRTPNSGTGVFQQIGIAVADEVSGAKVDVLLLIESNPIQV